MNYQKLALALAFSGILANAYAGTTDTLDHTSPGTGTPTYFVDSDANKGSAPYYRWQSEDWGWTHNALVGSITTASLNISAYDIDYSSGERDEVFAMDSGTWKSLGFLTGSDGAWAFSTFTLGNDFYDDIQNGLQVKLDIDTTSDGWAVTVAKSSLSIDGGALPPPPPVPEPETYAMLLAGLGIIRAMTRKKRA